MDPDDAELAINLKGERGIPVSSLAGALLELGHAVTVVTSTDEVLRREEFNGLNFKLIVLPQRSRPRDLALSLYRAEVKLISEEIEKLDVDVVNAHWTYEHALASSHSGRPLVVTAHDSPWQVLKTAHHPFWFFRYFLAIQARLQTKNMIFVSRDLQNKWKREMFWRKPSWVIPNIQPFVIKDEIKFEKTSNVINIISVGDTSPRKNIEGAIAAFEKARKKYPNIQLNLVGPGLVPYTAYYRSIAKRYSIEGINWHGYIERPVIQNLLQSSDILFQPSLVESFGLTLIEAMALGVTVLAGRNTGAASEVVGNCGMLVDSRNIFDMTDGLIKLIENPEMRKNFENAGKERVKRQFSPEVVARLALDCYRQIIDAEKEVARNFRK